jgi:arylsulfatase A-like enzyme
MMDDEIGRVLATLDRLDLEENTLVIFASDNGYMFGSHGRSRKQVWFEESVRVPAIVRWPGRVAVGSVVSPIVSVDFLPTALDAAGLRAPADLEGVSMLPVLAGRKPLRTIGFAELRVGPRYGGEDWKVARQKRFKYVRFRDGHETLYDLLRDPHEEKDASASAAAHEQLLRLRAALDAWLKRTPPVRR